MSNRQAIEMTVALRNNLIKSRRQERGWSQKELAIRAGVTVARVQEMERLHVLKPQLMERVLTCLAAALDCEPHELWDESMSAVTKHTTVRLFNTEDVVSFSSHQANALYITDDPTAYESRRYEADRRQKIEQVLLTLKPREERIVRAVYGLDGEPTAIAELAKREGVSVQRIYQLERQTMRKLQHWTRKRLLSEFDPTPPEPRAERTLRYKRDEEGHIINEGDTNHEPHSPV